MYRRCAGSRPAPCVSRSCSCTPAAATGPRTPGAWSIPKGEADPDELGEAPPAPERAPPGGVPLRPSPASRPPPPTSSPSRGARHAKRPVSSRRVRSRRSAASRTAITRSSTRGRSNSTATPTPSPATPSTCSGRRARAGRRASPRSTAPRGSTSPTARVTIMPIQRRFIDDLAVLSRRIVRHLSPVVVILTIGGHTVTMDRCDRRPTQGDDSVSTCAAPSGENPSSWSGTASRSRGWCRYERPRLNVTPPRRPAGAWWAVTRPRLDLKRDVLEYLDEERADRRSPAPTGPIVAPGVRSLAPITGEGLRRRLGRAAHRPQPAGSARRLERLDQPLPCQPHAGRGPADRRPGAPQGP